MDPASQGSFTTLAPAEAAQRSHLTSAKRKVNLFLINLCSTHFIGTQLSNTQRPGFHFHMIYKTDLKLDLIARGYLN